MDLKEALLALTFGGGILGMISGVYVAAFRLSTESVASPNLVTRYWYRYLIFSFDYMLSFLTTPALIKPLDTFLPVFEGDANSYFAFVLCLPLAIFLYYFEYRLIVWGDTAKRRAA